MVMRMTEQDRELLALVIGHRVKNLRQEQFISQEQLAKGICSQPLLSFIENGTQLPAPDVLTLIATKLNDSTLHDYANSLESVGESTGYEELMWTILRDQETLLHIIQNRKGKWSETLEQVALDLFAENYSKSNIDYVMELARVIINNKNGSKHLYARACFYHGSSLLLKNQYEKAIPWLTDAFNSEVGEYSKDLIFEGRITYNLGYALTEGGLQELALHYASKATEIFNRVQDYPKYGKSLGLLGVVQHRIGLHEDAYRSLHLANDILVKWAGELLDIARVECSLSDVCIVKGQYEESKLWSRKAIESGAGANDPAASYFGYRNLLLIIFMQHVEEDHRTILANALTMADNFGNPDYLGEINLLASYFSHSGDTKTTYLLTAIEHFKNARDFRVAGQVYELLSKIYESLGKSHESRDATNAALQMFKLHANQSKQIFPLELLLNNP